MTIKIIKEGRLPPKPEHQHTCTVCTCVFSYQYGDTKYDYPNRAEFIFCPFCQDHQYM